MKLFSKTPVFLYSLRNLDPSTRIAEIRFFSDERFYNGFTSGAFLSALSEQVL